MRCTRGLEKIHEAMILCILKRGSLYGWEIKKELERNFGCKINFGNLYKSLAELKQKRVITYSKEKSDKGPIRKVYKITNRGYKYLDLWIQELKKQKLLIEKILKNFTSL